MATIEICDKCEGRGNVRNYGATTGNRMDAAGGTEYIGWDIELCESCAAKMFVRAIMMMTVAQRIEFNEKFIQAKGA